METIENDNASLARELIADYGISIPIIFKTGSLEREMEVAGIKEIAFPHGVVEDSLNTIGDTTSDVMAYVVEHANALSAWETDVHGQENLLFNFTDGLVKLITSDSHFSRTPHEIVGEPITRKAVYDISSLGSYESPLQIVDKARVKELCDIEEAEFAEISLKALEAGNNHGFGAYQFVLDCKPKNDWTNRGWILWSP